MRTRTEFWRDVATAGAMVLSVPGVTFLIVVVAFAILFLLVAAAVAIVALSPTIAIALALDEGES